MRTIASAIVIMALLPWTSGCATRGWVREVLGQKDAEVQQHLAQTEERIATQGEGVARLEAQVGQHSTRLEALDAGVGRLEKSIGEASQMAQEARDRAGTALAKAEETESRLGRLAANRHRRTLVDTVHVYFGFDQWSLDDAAETTLVRVVDELRSNPGLTADLEGYADPAGPPEHNIGLSQRRVEAVRRFLVRKGIEIARIHAVGLGPLGDSDTREERAKRRRVTVKLLASAE